MRTAIASLLILTVTAAPARAQVFVQTPWASVRVGPPGPSRVLVQTPWATIAVPVQLQGARSPAPPPSSEPVYIPGAPPPVPVPVPVEAPATRVPTLGEFAASFQPKGGRYEVEIEHPATGRPVRVSFTLPDGAPRRVKVHRRELDFEYAGRQVSIRFLRDGEVRVRD